MSDQHAQAPGTPPTAATNPATAHDTAHAEPHDDHAAHADEHGRGAQPLLNRDPPPRTTATAFFIIGLVLLLVVGFAYYGYFRSDPNESKYRRRVSSTSWRVTSALCPKVLITDGTAERYVDFPPPGYGPSSARLAVSKNRTALMDAVALCKKFITPDASADMRAPRTWTVVFELDEDGNESGNYEFFPPVGEISRVHGIAPEPPAPAQKAPEPPAPPTEPTVN